MLGGKQSDILFKYADDATWQNRKNLKAGVFEKEELLALLTANFPQYDISSIILKFSVETPTEEFTDLIFVLQLQLGDQYTDPVDGVVSKEFIDFLYEKSKIQNKDKAELILAYLISKYRSKSLLSYESDYLAQMNESSRNNPVDGFIYQIEKKDGQYFQSIGGPDFYRSVPTYYDPYADINAKVFMARQIIIENLIEIEKIGNENQKNACKSFSDDEITKLAYEIVNRTQKTRAQEIDEPILEEKEKDVKDVIDDYSAILSIGNLARMSGSRELLDLYSDLLEIERLEEKPEECDAEQLAERKNWFIEQIRLLMLPYESSGSHMGRYYIFNSITNTYEFPDNPFLQNVEVDEFARARFNFKRYLIYVNGTQVAGIEQLNLKLSSLYAAHPGAKLVEQSFFFRKGISTEA